MISEPTCLVVIVAPLALEDALVDELLEHPEWAPGFNTMRIEGHGRGVAWTTTKERVRGRVGRLRLEMPTTRAGAAALIAHLRAVLPNPQIFYWAVPLDICGGIPA